MPGGGVEGGESIAQAAIREAYEETGLEVDLIRLVGNYARPRWQHSSSHVCVFAALATGGTLHAQADERIDLGFFDLQSLPTPLLSGQHRRISDAFSGVGGSVVCSQGQEWPFPQQMSRRELYDLRDRSGLSRQQFYLQHLRMEYADETQIEISGTIGNRLKHC